MKKSSRTRKQSARVWWLLGLIILLPLVIAGLYNRTSTFSEAMTPKLSSVDYCLQFDQWFFKNDSNYRADAPFYTSTNGQQLQLKMRASSTSITIYTAKGPNLGKMRVFIDDIDKGVVDLYQATEQFQVPLTYPLLTNTPHMVKVVALDNKNPLSTGTEIVVDGMSPDGGTFCDSSGPLYSYNSWIPIFDSRAHDGSYFISSLVGAEITDSQLSTVSTKVTWITAKGPNGGKAELYIDGALIRTVDLYNPTTIWQHAEVVDGLPFASHVPKIKIIAPTNSLTKDPAVIFDSFLYE